MCSLEIMMINLKNMMFNLEVLKIRLEILMLCVESSKVDGKLIFLSTKGVMVG